MTWHSSLQAFSKPAAARSYLAFVPRLHAYSDELKVKLPRGACKAMQRFPRVIPGYVSRTSLATARSWLNEENEEENPRVTGV